MKKQIILSGLVLSIFGVVSLIFFACQKDNDYSENDIQQSDTLTSSTASNDESDKFSSIKKLISNYYLDAPTDAEISDIFAVDEETALKYCNEFLSLINVQITKENASLLPMKFESDEVIWLVEDNTTGLQCTVDAKSGMLLSIVGDIDVALHEFEVVNLCKEYAKQTNDRVEGLFSDGGNYYINMLDHKMTYTDATMKQIRMVYYSEENNVSVTFTNHSTRFANGDIANIKSGDRYFAIGISITDDSFTPIRSEYVYDAEIAASIDQDTVAQVELTESEAEKIVLSDIEKINAFLPDKIDKNNCKIESFGINRISGGACLQTLFGVTLTESNGRKVDFYITPQLKKVTHVIYDTDKKYTLEELKALSDEFLKYLGFKSERYMYGNFDDFSFAGNYLYEMVDLDSDLAVYSDFEKNSILAVESNGKLYLYLSNGIKLSLYGG